MYTGIYKAYKRWSETYSVEPRVLLNNIQAWLSIFGFSTSAFGIFLAIWRWLFMSTWPSPLVFGLLGIGSAFLVALAVIVVLSIVALYKMLRYSIKGIHYKFDASTAGVDVLEAIEPIHEHTNLKGYKIVVERLTKEQSKLSNSIVRYKKAIQELESDNGKPESKGEK